MSDIFKSRKSMVIMYFLFFGVLAGIGLWFLFSDTAKPEYNTAYLGEVTIETIKSAQQMEKMMVYVDQAAKLSAYQSLHETAENGGCQKDAGSEYNIWDFKECIPGTSSASETFKQLLSKRLNSFLSLYKSIAIPVDNYGIDITDEVLKGNAKSAIKVPISGDKGFLGFYERKPDFAVNLNGYDFSDYDKLAESSRDFIELCNENPGSCVESTRQQFFTDFIGNEYRLLDDAQCESSEKQEFFLVSDYLESCYFSQDNSCICTAKPAFEGEYELKQQGSDVIITRKNSKLSKTMANAALFVDSYKFGTNSFAHKDNNGKLIIQEYFESKQCAPKPQTRHRFCVQSNNEFNELDEDGTIKMAPITYKFSLDFGTVPDFSSLEPSGDSDVKEGVRRIARETAFASELIALKLAKTESNFQHCKDKTLSCGTLTKENVLTNGQDYGVMQINIKAHSDLFTPGSVRLAAFGCKNGETVYDFECNVKAGLKILEQKRVDYGTNTARYNAAVDKNCDNPKLNKKYKSYTNQWDRALRAYNGFGCAIEVASYVESVNSAVV